MNARITTGMTQRAVLSDLNRVNGQLIHAQEKAASGREITRPSDDPYGTAKALQLRQALSGTKQHQRNVEDAQGWQDTTEQALSSVTEVVHRAQELLIEGASDTADPAGRLSIAAEIDQLIASAKESANTNYNGRFIFSGTRTDQAPYTQGASDTYGGTTATIAREIGPGVSIDVAIPGVDVLGQGGGDGKLLDTLRNIAANLRAGNTTVLQSTDLPALSRNLDEVMGTRALNGARTNRLDAALTRLQQVEESTTASLSETEDADIAKTLIELNSQQAAYQAALRAGSQILQSSLMDFLH